MKEESTGIYGKPNFGMIVGGFVVALVVCLLLGLWYFKSGHPVMHTNPQPQNNKGQLTPAMHPRVPPPMVAA